MCEWEGAQNNPLNVRAIFLILWDVSLSHCHLFSPSLPPLSLISLSGSLSLFLSLFPAPSSPLLEVFTVP
jgi:hypothetical protein